MGLQNEREGIITDLAKLCCASSSNRGNCEKCEFVSDKSCSHFATAQRLYGAGYRKKELIAQQAKELDRRDEIIKDQEAEIERLKKVLHENGVYSYMNRHGRAVWNI